MRNSASPLPLAPEEQDGSSSLQATALRWLPLVITLLFALGVARSLLSSFHTGVPWMVYEEDDFFYYLKIAQNLAQGHGSTFNGIVATNGYHPLWLLVLTALSFVTTDPRHVMLFVSVSTFLATLAVYFLSRTMHFVATDYPPYSTGCVHVVEPYQAGPDSPHMAADFCEAPVATWVQDDKRTLVYDLQVSSSVTPAAP